jgi:polysaccharide pyruvyl transferase WcaK-like protein
VTSLVIAADIGGPDWYHAGDEAMLAANLDALRRLRPDVQVTAVSRDPDWTSHHYGVQAIAPVGLGPSREQRVQLECEILAHTHHFTSSGMLPSSQPIADVIRAIAQADALVLSGGGHLCSHWPEQIHDRSVLMQIAHQCHKPIVVLGQTIGPHLDEDDRDRLTAALSLASLIGVRGDESAALVRSLGIAPTKITQQLDDAWFLNAAPSAAVMSEAARHAHPWIAVTLAPLKGDIGACLPVLESFGRQCSAISRVLDADLVFLPHWNALPGHESDAVFARRLFGFLEEPKRATLLPVYTGEDTCWLTRQASLVVTTRYHPIVFGLSGGVPCVGIFPDEHTRVRQAECLRQAGLEQYSISFDAAVGGGLLTSAHSAWQERGTIGRQLDARAATWRAGESRKWSLVSKALGWPETPLPASVPASEVIPAAEDRPARAAAAVPRARDRARSALDISAVVLTRNGAGRLDRCLQSIVDAGIARELVVFVDACTTDESDNIARRFTSKVARLTTHGYIEFSLERLAAACAGDFVLRIDDDETLGGDWETPLTDAVEVDRLTHFLMPRRWLVPGQDAFISSGEWCPDLQLRLFRNDPERLHWPSRLHEHLTVDGPGAVLWDRWIDHHVLWQRSRAERVAKCAAYQQSRPDKHLSHFYLWEDQAVRLTSTDPTGDAAADPLDSGAVVSFGSDGHSSPYRLDGWSHVEPWGTWTDGPVAVLRLPLKRPASGPLEVILEATAFVHRDHPCQPVSVICADRVVAEWRIDTADVADYTITLPASLVAGQGVIVLTLHLRDPKTPCEVQASTDARRLGLGVRRLRLIRR